MGTPCRVVLHEALALEDEDDIPQLVLSASNQWEGAVRVAKILVSKICTSKTVVREHVIPLVGMLWKPKGTFEVESIKDNHILFRFGLESEFHRVFIDGPWILDDNLIVLETPTEKLGGMIGSMEEVDVNALLDCLGNFIRVCFFPDISKPLPRVIKATLLDGEVASIIAIEAHVSIKFFAASKRSPLGVTNRSSRGKGGGGGENNGFVCGWYECGS
ncbi:hypothetical protein F8388_017558 [Cannabis sativa]|uniref:DUF4283 domain-containing protein n=1 Tax=Cannabis sativa TaxID=3483 RepID=A0A7J6G2D5_CANSA|nr:hypothetical protein F8388_017558 [Cannabis sativa]KAF4403715.1 hypothetical protein G4B88_002568 [Cannabis sativa]